MRGIASSADAAVKWLGSVSLVIAGLSLVAMMIVGALDSITTAAFNWPVPAATELASVLLAASIFGALPYTQRLNQNIAVDIVESMFPARARRICRFLSLTTGALFFALLTWRAVVAAIDATTFREYAAGAIALPIYPFKIIVAFTLAATTAEFLRQTALALAGDKTVVETPAAAAGEA